MNQKEIKQYLTSQCYLLNIEPNEDNLKILMDILLKYSRETKCDNYTQTKTLKEINGLKSLERPYIGDLFTLIDFVNDCDNGCLIDDDGYGSLVIKSDDELYETTIDAMMFSDSILSIYSIDQLSEKLLQRESKSDIEKIIRKSVIDSESRIFVMWYNK